MKAHELFLSHLYLNHTILFVGLSADDMALSERLVSLKKTGFEAPRLFWLTTRNDQHATQWASTNDVQRIVYRASSDAEHAKVIDFLVKDATSFRSHDAEIKPGSSSTVRVFDLDQSLDQNPRDIANRDPESVRKILSNRLQEDLRMANDKTEYDVFDKFVNKYNFAIQTRSFYRFDSQEDKVFFDYKLHFPELGTGNFGTVYTAERADGSLVAVKIMHNHILYTREMLGGFRRGVRSMKILTSNRVQGVVGFCESFEMPPTVVMEHVSGNSIEELFPELGSFSWQTKLLIGKRISEVVDSCHKLPEMVLHRDIKPSNVMIKGLDYITYEIEDIAVLDFDMSWHKGSNEKDVVFESRDDFGYLAPEQTSSGLLGSARSTKVDSFGLGMTLYALFSGRHPLPGQALSGEWGAVLRAGMKQGFIGEWSCFPERLSRAVHEATLVDQKDRLEFSSLRIRLEKMMDAFEGVAISIDLAAEEILHILSNGMDYDWNDVSDRGFVEFVSGVEIALNSRPDREEISVQINYIDRGSRAHKKRNDLIGVARNNLRNLCKDENFRNVRMNVNHGLLSFSFAMGFIRRRGVCLDIASKIREAISPLHNIS